jgi:hypothetical protein
LAAADETRDAGLPAPEWLEHRQARSLTDQPGTSIIVAKRPDFARQLQAT